MSSATRRQSGGMLRSYIECRAKMNEARIYFKSQQLALGLNLESISPQLLILAAKYAINGNPALNNAEKEPVFARTRTYKNRKIKEHANRLAPANNV